MPDFFKTDKLQLTIDRQFENNVSGFTTYRCYSNQTRESQLSAFIVTAKFDVSLLKYRMFFINCKQISSLRFLEEKKKQYLQKYPCYQKSCDSDLLCRCTITLFQFSFHHETFQEIREICLRQSRIPGKSTIYFYDGERENRRSIIISSLIL